MEFLVITTLILLIVLMMEISVVNVDDIKDDKEDPMRYMRVEVDRSNIELNENWIVLAQKWEDLQDREDVLIIDTETTGLDENAEVIEIALVRTTGQLRYYSLCLPQDPIPEEVSNIHGLTLPKLESEGAQPWPDVHKDLIGILQHEQNLFIGWNVGFDLQMIRQTTWRYDLGLPWMDSRDLLREYREYMGETSGQGKHRLINVAQRCGVSTEQSIHHATMNVEQKAHRALVDCGMVWGILKSIQAGAKQVQNAKDSWHV